ncbi:MAG: hypothetical protein KF708_18540 [Pirellulales bacterium]|nr:hypothetical protein [Pirellulales bacterium]
MKQVCSNLDLRRLTRCVALVVWAGASAWSATAAEAPVPPPSKVGLTARLSDVILAGTELEARPWDDRTLPLVLRIEATYPHGDRWRYDFAYFGLEPGKYSLRDYLRRKDGSSTDDLPPLEVEISGALPTGHVAPHELAATEIPQVGGYRQLMIAATIVWLVGLALILFARRRHQQAQAAAVERPRTLAERLRPMVEEALQGKLAPESRAELERLLLTYWRRRLQLENLKAADAMARLREHEEAGAMLRQLELWLHHPTARESVDLAALLRPYQDLPADQDALQPAAEMAR